MHAKLFERRSATSFECYVRFGTRLTAKSEFVLPNPTPGGTSLYVWRTKRDGRVRASHAANEGGVFAIGNPPPTGHPGEDYGCRCEAVPYYPGATEFAYHAVPERSVADDFRPEAWGPFVAHFYRGGGRTVTLEEMGHDWIVFGQFAYHDRDETNIAGGLN